MNSTDIILIALLLFFMSIHLASAMMMYQYMIQRGEKLSIFLMRLKIFSAISKYIFEYSLTLISRYIVIVLFQNIDL